MCSNLSKEMLSCFVFLFPENFDFLGLIEDFKGSFLEMLPCLVAKWFPLFFAEVCLFFCLHCFTTSTISKISTPRANILLLVAIVITISCDNPADEVVTGGGGTSETVVGMSEPIVEEGSETVVGMSELMVDKGVVKPIM